MNPLKVAVLSYPMLTQTPGGLEIQVNETIAALNALGCEARLIDPFRERLPDFDLVHVFGAGSGNFRIVQFARLLDRPVVMSPLIRPHWTRALGARARWLDAAVAKLTRWTVSTEYRDLHSGLSGSARLLALGSIERRCIVDAFRIAPEKIEVVPNGIPPRFFDAMSDAFCARFGMEPGFVLNVASIDSHKNQLGLAQALAGSDLRLVLIGPCEPANQDYLERLKTFPNVSYIGALRYDDPLLASAYAAAGVFCLTSHSEVMPLTVLESLAAGTPAVMTRNHGMDTATMRSVIQEVDPLSPGEIAVAVRRFLAQPPAAAACRLAVEHLTWPAVAAQLVNLYTRVVQAHGTLAPSAGQRGAETTAALARG